MGPSVKQNAGYLQSKLVAVGPKLKGTRDGLWICELEFTLRLPMF